MSEKYGEAIVADTARKLADNSVQVFYGVDATKLDSEQTHAILNMDGTKFDRIVFNFPHAGTLSKDGQDAAAEN